MDLRGQFHFDPATYDTRVRDNIPDYEQLQERTAAASGDLDDVRNILDMGVGTGETLLRVLAHHPNASLVGIDASEQMLAVARTKVPGADLRISRLEDRLPDIAFDLVVSALAVHHLDDPGKADLFHRVFSSLRPGGRFVLTDLVVPDDPNGATVPRDEDHDQPSTVTELVGWLNTAGFSTHLEWSRDDLATIIANRPA